MRQPTHIAAAGCLVIVLGAAGVSAQGGAPTPAPQPTAAAADAAALSMKAISRLFAEAGGDATRRPPQNAPTPGFQPLLICGMKVLRPDPTIDPKFETPLRDTRTRFTILTVPVLCR
jgi:hypothetical protein